MPTGMQTDVPTLAAMVNGDHLASLAAGTGTLPYLAYELYCY